MTTYSLSTGQLADLLRSAKGATVFAPQATAKATWLERMPSEASFQELRQPRSTQSPKGFLMPPTESVGRYPQEASATATATQVGRTVLVGVRACELRAMAYLDRVMLSGEFEDPVYARRREAVMLVSCDCLDCTESCFCTRVGGQPYPTEGFDLNLSVVNDGFLVEVGSDKGKDLLGRDDFDGPSPAQIARRDENRRKITERVQANNSQVRFQADDKTQPALPEGDAADWQKFAADCVECGACTNICPTCYCFYLYDQVLGPEQFERVRTWDSCLLSTYHRMAGGAQMKLSPRPWLASRLANRVLHKFTYGPQQVERLGCVGCGRCIDACLGAIDIRDVVSELSP